MYYSPPNNVTGSTVFEHSFVDMGTEDIEETTDIEEIIYLCNFCVGVIHHRNRTKILLKLLCRGVYMNSLQSLQGTSNKLH